MGRVYVWRRSTATALERPWQLTWSELDAMQPNATEIAVGEAGIMVSPAQPAAPAAAGAAGHCQPLRAAERQAAAPGAEAVGCTDYPTRV